MAFDLTDPNHLIASVAAAVAVMDVVFAQFLLPAVLAKNPRATPDKINIIRIALFAAAAFMLAMSFYFSHYEPIHKTL